MALVLAALAVLLLSGCRTELTTTVDLRRDGSGVVSLSMLLDRDAATALRGLGPLDRLVGAADLRADGWQVVGPVPRPPGGFVEYRADKVVHSPEEAQAALARVSQAFAALRVERSTGPATVRLEVSGDVDLTGGAEGLAGDEVLTRTFGAPLGHPSPRSSASSVPRWPSASASPWRSGCRAARSASSCPSGSARPSR